MQNQPNPKQNQGQEKDSKYSGQTDHLESDAEKEVIENEDASLQDKEYSFDEENTENEEYHDADDESARTLDDLFDEQTEDYP